MTPAVFVTDVLAAEPEGPEFGKASPLGLLIIILLLVATALLIRSMNKQLKKLPQTFDAEHPEPDQAFDDGTDSVSDSDAAPESTTSSSSGPVGSSTAGSTDDSVPAGDADERRSADT